MSHDRRLARRLAQSRRRLARLGYENPDRPINVRHYAYFLRRRDADQFMAQLKDEGLEVIRSRAGIDHVVYARLPADRGDRDVNAAVRAMYSTVRSLHGTYGGWDEAFFVDDDRGIFSCPEPPHRAAPTRR